MTPRPGFKVGPITVDPPLLLAPMEDVSSLPMRVIAKRIAGPGLMFTEFVSAMAIHHGAEKTFRKMRIHPEERPLGIQIFGGVPEIMAETAQHCEAAGADLIDINMGCWVPKVCRTGSGAALLKDPEVATAIVAAVVKAVRVPVTVKVRAGFEYGAFAAPDLVQRFQDVGAQMITLHARFAKQGFEGQADWDLIKQMRKVVSVPLIGNGDVKSGEDAIRMLNETGCDGVMAGRAAISNPWLLQSIRCAITGEPETAKPTLDERLEVVMEHARMMVAYRSDSDTLAEAKELPTFAECERRAITSLRGQLPLYVKGVFGASEYRARLSRVNTLAELQVVMDEVRATARDHETLTTGA
ncbi:MAG: tRNA dihydrouridine synthase DusB [Fimbriimonadaceae bacterium]|nr:tRNA dihydrouridine synthase DusB [Fimbriimonadaceae bacterium]